MQIVGFRHKGLQRLYEKAGIPKLYRRLVLKLRMQLTVLDDLTHSDQLLRLEISKTHQLSDNRWSFCAAANLRLTFLANDIAEEISILDLEGYH